MSRQRSYGRRALWHLPSGSSPCLPDAGCQGKCRLDDALNGICLLDEECQGIYLLDAECLRKFLPDAECQGKFLPNAACQGKGPTDDTRHGICILDAARVFWTQGVKANVV